MDEDWENFGTQKFIWCVVQDGSDVHWPLAAFSAETEAWTYVKRCLSRDILWGVEKVPFMATKYFDHPITDQKPPAE